LSADEFSARLPLAQMPGAGRRERKVLIKFLAFFAVKNKSDA
jgi:hypothetical protein